MSKTKQTVRKHNYVVGYEGDHHCVYGKDAFKRIANAHPMTEFAAHAFANRLPCFGRATVIVYKLVPVTTYPKRTGRKIAKGGK